MRPAAIFALFGVFFIAGSFGTIANTMLNLRPALGLLIDLNATMRALWRFLLLAETDYGSAFVRGLVVDSGLPSWVSLVSLLGFCGLTLLLLMKKIRACEVVR